ncbi:MAG: proline--tRNA ligase [Planctomycetota bacterium]|nr:proline--tRNA ligase [Planctomycetota bacterium]
MRWSQTLIPTLKEDPSDAEIVSHKLMLRAGLIRKLSAGAYSYLPLGLRSLNKIINIVREEMDAAGAAEVLMPVLQPAELWRESGRFDGFGDLMCRFTDRAGRVNVLGPTHEEVITSIVRDSLNSYRQLPVTLYQIQTKFRDEVRPRFGVLRSREFQMKDAYSFDVDEAGLGHSYKAMYDAYCRIFSRCGLKYRPVEADTGLIGGDVSHEFMVPAESGEDIMLSCAKCGYDANAERAECPPTKDAQGPCDSGLAGKSNVREVSTPGAHTVEQVCKFLNTEPAQLIKTLIYMADGKPVAVLVRGDREINQAKLQRFLKAGTLEMASAVTILDVTGGPLGFSGPVGLKLRMVADWSVWPMKDFVTGANKADTHLVEVNLGKDFKIEEFSDLRMAKEGDRCPRCEGTLALTHGIEVGHVFKLGTKYSSKMNALFRTEKGEQKPMVMGCYGIGINRIMASAIELYHDEHGVIWPMSIAPYQVIIVSLRQDDEQIMGAAKKIYENLQKVGVEVLWDDRDLAPGVKFNDADLIGIPIRVTVGNKVVKAGTVDVKPRSAKEQVPVFHAGAVEAVTEMLQKYTCG